MLILERDLQLKSPGNLRTGLNGIPTATVWGGNPISPKCPGVWMKPVKIKIMQI